MSEQGRRDAVRAVREVVLASKEAKDSNKAEETGSMQTGMEPKKESEAKKADTDEPVASVTEVAQPEASSVNVVRLPVRTVGSSGERCPPDILIQGHTLTHREYMCDTGSAYGLVAHSFVKMLGVKVETCEQPLLAVNQTLLVCAGVCQLSVQFGPDKVDGLFHVIDKPEHVVLIGGVILTALGITLSNGRGENYMSVQTGGRRESLVRRIREVIPCTDDDKEAIFLFGDHDGKPMVGAKVALDEEQLDEPLDDDDGLFNWEFTVSVKEEEEKLGSPDNLVDSLDVNQAMPAESVARMRSLLRENVAAFSSVYSSGDCQNVENLGSVDVYHEIETGDSLPIRMRPRRVPLNDRVKVEAMVDDLLAQGVIRPSTSPWAACLVLARKKDGSLRLCVDYRQLNKVTRRDAFPLPRIDDCLDTLAGKTVFSTLDIKCGYHNVHIAESDICKTAFSANDRLYEFVRLPFGLSNAPATFSRMMCYVFREVIGKFVSVYLDDILIHSASLEEHFGHVDQVLKILEASGLRLNPKKCSFLQSQLKFLGHVISAEGVRVDPDKAKAVRDFPRPVSKRDMQRFVGLVNYLRRFSPNLSARLAPFQVMMAECASQIAPLQWTDETRELFDVLRRELSSPPMLALPVLGQPFVITTDASREGFGAVLEQEQEGTKRVIAYASKRTSRSERKYAAVELEARGLVCAVEAFRPYITGVLTVVYTDHRPLLSLFRKELPSAKLYRWALILQQFQLELRYMPGRQNEMADALSRAPLVNAVSDGREVIQAHHEGAFGCHAGAKKMFQMMSPFYSADWPSLKADIDAFVARCNVCKQRCVRYEKLVWSPRPPPAQPRELWYMDFTEIRRESRFPYCLVIVDGFSRWMFAIHTDSQCAATAIKGVQMVLRTLGCPKEVTTDQGTHFMAKSFQQFLTEHEIVHSPCTPYNKGSTGIVERANRTLQEALAKKLATAGRKLSTWYLMLAETVLSYNVTPHGSLGGHSPFEVLHGCKFSMRSDQFEESPVLKDFWSEIRGHILRSQDVTTRAGSSKQATVFKEGDLVFIRNTAKMAQRMQKIDLVNSERGCIVSIGRRSAMVEVNGVIRPRPVPLRFLQLRSEE